MWDYRPWDNDRAADWYGDLMDATGLRDRWLEGVNSEDADVVRAATGLFLLLGHVYVWPIADYDDDLELSIVKSRGLLDVEEYEESDELLDVIRQETAELESRRKPARETPAVSVPDRPWWKFW